jgi:hypothetical protein
MVAAALLALLPSAPALACAACSLGADDGSAVAFLKGTLLLSLMPLGIMGGVVWYIIRAVRRRDSAPETVWRDLGEAEDGFGRTARQTPPS